MILYLDKDVQTTACIPSDTLLDPELESAMTHPFWWGAQKTQEKCPGLECMCFEEFFTQKACWSRDDSSNNMSQLTISRWLLLIHVSASCWLVGNFELPLKGIPPPHGLRNICWIFLGSIHHANRKQYWKYMWKMASIHPEPILKSMSWFCDIRWGSTKNQHGW